MNKMKPEGVKILKMFHLVFFSMWLGGALTLVLLNSISYKVNSNDLRGLFTAMKYIDDIIIIPGALGSMFTGAVYGIWTRFGFFRLRWVTVKWIFTVLQILFGTFFLGVWLGTCVDTLAHTGSAVMQNPEFIHSALMLKIWSPLQAGLLIFMAVISVVKPWKKQISADS